MSILSSWLKLSAVVSTSVLLAACNNSGENLSGNCELNGSSFGIVGGSVLASGNELSASTVIVAHSPRKGEAGICTGTLIAEDTVLTAAHCIENESRPTAIAFSNSVDCAGTDRTAKVRTIKSQVVHPKYRNFYGRDKAVYDVAILKFSGGLPTGYKTRELPAASYRPNPANQLVMAGYGNTSYGKDDSGILRYTMANGTRLSNEYYSASSRSVVKIPDALVVEQRNNGVCSGDSGGPLYTYDRGNLVLLGVVSMGVDNVSTSTNGDGKLICNGVSIFADVRKNLGWIKEQMRNQ